MFPILIRTMFQSQDNLLGSRLVTAYGAGFLACTLNCFKSIRSRFMPMDEGIVDAVHLFIQFDQERRGTRLALYCL